MSHHIPPFLILFTSLSFSLLTALPVLPNPDPAPIHHQQQAFHKTPSPPATIPSFPEQSAVQSCPLHLPAGIFPAVKSSCGRGQLSRSKCCPVLAAWLYSAYSETALGFRGSQSAKTKTTSFDDMPLLPDDSETCVDGLESEMRDKGVKLMHPNSSCDVVYCYCGIRLHQLSCPQAFHVTQDGRLSGDFRVNKLEKNCLHPKKHGQGHGHRKHSTLASCSKCLNSLYKLKKPNTGKGNATKVEARTSKMHNRDCELMGLTWLLNKDRDAYISTVTLVLRALMLNSEDSDPLSCSLNSDGMPLAVDSEEINGQSSSTLLHFSLYLYLFSSLLIMSSNFLPYTYSVICNL